MKNLISKKELREFGFIIGFAFPIIIGWLLPLIRGYSFMNWTLLIGIPALILGIAKPTFLLSSYKTWIRIGYIMGWINRRIILGFIFLFILLPISLFMKLFGYDPLKFQKSKKLSYREINSKHSIDLERIF